MTDDHETASSEEGKHRRGLKFRRGDDYAVELFTEALGNLTDVERVGRILAELGRFYNPYVNAPIVDAATRRQALEALERGDQATARGLIETRLAQYSPSWEGPPPASDPP